MVEAVCFSNEHVYIPSSKNEGLEVCQYCGLVREVENQSNPFPKPELSKKMVEAISHMKRNGNKLVRFPGGYWAREGWHSWNGPCFGTPTVEAIVRRGYAEYTVWKDGKSGRFPIECGLTPLALDRGDSAVEATLSMLENRTSKAADTQPAPGK